MDYYIVVEGQKQGPFDLLGFMKKIKNGGITAETLVSNDPDGPFKPAVQFEEISKILATETVTKADGQSKSTLIKPKLIISDGIELWSRKIVEYSVFVGFILILSFALMNLMLKVNFFAEYSFIANYVICTFTTTLIGLFFYFVLLTKRSQEPEWRELKSVLIRSAPSMFLFCGTLSVIVMGYGINTVINIGVVVVGLIILSSLIFVPFLLVDHRMPLSRAFKLSMEAIRGLNSSIFFTIFLLVGVNILAAVLPTILTQELFMFGLFISVPITISALAYMYDQVFA